MRQSVSILVLLLLLLAPLAHAATSPFMAVHELRRGMRGVGKTVFQGTAIDTFAAQ